MPPLQRDRAQLSLVADAKKSLEESALGPEYQLGSVHRSGEKGPNREPARGPRRGSRPQHSAQIAGQSAFFDQQTADGEQICKEPWRRESPPNWRLLASVAVFATF